MLLSGGTSLSQRLVISSAERTCFSASRAECDDPGAFRRHTSQLPPLQNSRSRFLPFTAAMRERSISSVAGEGKGWLERSRRSIRIAHKSFLGMTNAQNDVLVRRSYIRRGRRKALAGSHVYAGEMTPSRPPFSWRLVSFPSGHCAHRRAWLSTGGRFGALCGAA